MNLSKHSAIKDYEATLMRAQEAAIQSSHSEALQRVRAKAEQSSNRASYLPAEADVIIDGIKARVLAKAQCLVKAYTDHGEPCAPQADKELEQYFRSHVDSSRTSFIKTVAMRGQRGGTLQVSPLASSFEGKSRSALLEGKALLEQQRVLMRNKPQPASPSITYVYHLHGANSRVNHQSTDNSVNISEISSEQLMENIRRLIGAEIQIEEQRAVALAQLTALESATSKPQAATLYQEFVATLADHVTLLQVLTPFLPALAQWVAVHFN